MIWLILIALAGALLFVILYKRPVNYNTVNTVTWTPPPAPPIEKPADAPAPVNFNDVFGAKNHLDDSDRRPHV